MISMKNDRIIASWNKIEPSDSANERMLSAILERNRSVQNGKDKVNYMSKTKKILIPAVACLALLIAVTGIVGANLNWFGTKTDAGAGVDGTVVPGGCLPEGIDPIVASVAVYPADRILSDIADATLNELSEAEAHSYLELGAYLPSAIPDGYQFKAASIYETTMKDGTKYHLLRVTYTTGDSGNDDMAPVAEFTVQLTDFQPNTEKTIYTVDTLPNELSEKGFLHIAWGDVYVGIDTGDLTRDDVLSVLNPIN